MLISEVSQSYLTKIMEINHRKSGTFSTASLSFMNFVWIHLIWMLLCCMPKFTTIALDPLEATTAHQQTSSSLANNLHVTIPNCTLVRPVFESRGINPDDLPRDALNETTLRYCQTPQGSCCTQNIETKLTAASRMQLDKNTKEAIGKLASVLGTRATKFNDFFKELLTESKKGFHDMFKRTYGVIYEQNSYVFSDLFTELENYYTRGKVDLAEELDTFFNILYQKMFSVLNSQYTFDDKYLGCVSEHMKELKPFGDVPDKLSVQIKRSFVATRTYEQALVAAAEVARNMINLRPNVECSAALMKMQQCSLCNGYAQVRPCSNYCVNVMKGCLHYYNEMDTEWDNFVASMEKVSERLLGPFNIVMVVEPINIKISEAIMNFQETGHDISQRVFEGCGRPQLGPRKRSVNPKFTPFVGATTNNNNKNNDDERNERDSFTFDEQSDVDQLASPLTTQQRQRRSGTDPTNRELQYEPLKFSNSDEVIGGEADSSNRNRKKQKQTNNKRRKEDNDDNKEPQMDKLVKDIRQRVKDSKKFWSNLPFQICNNEEFSAPPSMEGNCWNGHTVDRYQHTIVTELHSNPEFVTITSGTRQSSLIAGQLFTLRNAIGHLRNAYNGMDVEWSDGEDSYFGSGSGSGAGIDDDDDDDNANGNENGSGINSYDFQPRVPTNTDTGKHSNENTHHHDHHQPGHNTSLSGNHNGDDDDDEDDSNKFSLNDTSGGVFSCSQIISIYLLLLGGLLCNLL